MENQRLFLWLALGFVAFLTWQAWVKDYQQPPVSAPVQGPETSLPSAPSDADLPGMPDADRPAPVTEALEASAARGDRLRVTTDVLDLVIDTSGGGLVAATLAGYPVRKDRPDVLVELLNDSEDRYSVIRSGLRSASNGAAVVLDPRYRAEGNEFRLDEGQETLEVPMIWSSPDGLEVKKTFRFHRGSYAIEVLHEIGNGTGSDWTGASYIQIRQRQRSISRSMTDVDTYSYIGPVIYDGDKYEKLDPDDLPDEPVDGVYTAGWVAAIQHHFLVAAVPPGSDPASYKASSRAGVFSLSAVGNPVTVPAGGTAQLADTLFVGPKLQSQLRATAPGLVLTVDYGFLTIISQPLFWILEKFHAVTGNWGWAIILLTMLIKLIFYKLSETSGKSMAKMRKLQPRLKALQERYQDDRQALSQAMMQLYKQEKVNPAAGCLPILVQMPVFLALYWVLLESVEMRQAPFALWINDLSSKDPFFVLPLLMGVTMWIQQKLNPAPPDPVQAKVMMALPIVFTVFFAFFPAGLVLYWFVNNLLSIAQQWKINRVVERGH